MKIAICIHLYNLKLYDEFIKYINNITKIFENNIVIINLVKNIFFGEYEINKLIKKINNDIKNNIILFNENKGVDIYSFLIMLEYINNNNIDPDYIIKLHTKTHTEKWRKILIEPLVDHNNLTKLKNEIFLKKNVGFIASSKYIVKNDNHKWINNRNGFLVLKNKFNIDFDYDYFVAGTMFWINYSCLKNFKKNYKKINEFVIEKFVKGKPNSSRFENKIYYEFIFERIFTGFLTKNYNNYAVNLNNDFNIIDKYFLINNISEPDKKIFINKNYTIRKLKVYEYYYHYLDLLSQLTKLDPKTINFNLFKTFVSNLNNNHIILVIEDIYKKKIIATLTLIIEQKLIRNYGKVAHIEDVVVDKDSRGKGIGKKIINEAVTIAKKNNCYKIILDCDESNIPFYEKCNFLNKGAFMACYF